DAWTASAARQRAKELRRIVDGGGDPQGELHEHRGAPTIDELADRFMEERGPMKKARSRAEDESLLKQWIRPEVGSKKVFDRQHEDCERLHRKVTQAGTPYRANRVHSLLGTMLACAVKWKMRPDNPAKGVRHNPERQRNRYLSHQELASLTAALAEHPSRDGA